MNGTLRLDRRERETIIKGLNMVRSHARSNIARNKKRGWKPAPGRLDIDASRLQIADNLLRRLHENGAT